MDVLKLSTDVMQPIEDDNLIQLLNQYSGFVKTIANNAVKSSGVISREDLYQVGEMAVLRAAKSYDPACGSNIKSYIYSCVRRAIYNEAARFLGVFTVDHKVTELGAKITKLADSGLTYEEIANKLGKAAESVKELHLAYSRRHTVSLEFEIEVEADEPSVEEFLTLIRMTDNEKVILYDRILGDYSVQDVADKLSLSVKRVYSLESALRARIEHAIQNIV